MRVCVVTFPIGEAGNTPLSNLMAILCSLATDIHLITGNAGYTFFRDNKKIHTYGIKHKIRVNLFMRIMSNIYTQLRISYKLLKIIANVDIFIFFIGGEGLVLPMLVARLWRKKVVLALAGFPVVGRQIERDSLSKVTGFLSKINLVLSSRIIVYSKHITEERGLKKYENKISVGHEHFLNLNRFAIRKPVRDRERVVGYIGGLSRQKGVLNLLQAIPNILEKESEIKFLIAGDGNLFNFIGEFINKNELTDKVKLLGWIPHQELPEHLNELKLLILASYTEGLPNIMLESMACGTPVLVTPVGATPDLVKDGETGFILENNSPDSITRNVIKALSHPNLEQITRNARALVEKEYTFEAAVKAYEDVLASLK